MLIISIYKASLQSNAINRQLFLTTEGLNILMQYKRLNSTIKDLKLEKSLTQKQKWLAYKRFLIQEPSFLRTLSLHFLTKAIFHEERGNSVVWILLALQKVLPRPKLTTCLENVAQGKTIENEPLNPSWNNAIILFMALKHSYKLANNR